MRAMFSLLALALTACGAKEPAADAGSPDAGVTAVADAGTQDAGLRYPDGGSPYSYWDGGACVVKTDCPCFSSDDCGPGFTCHSEDTTDLHVYCVPGARGVGQPGVTCTGETDCLSALCVDNRCSALCDVAAECPATLPVCRYIGFGTERSICTP